MSAYIHHIATGTPPYAYPQGATRERLKDWTAEPKTKRLVHAIHNRSGIGTRHSVSGDFVDGTEATLYRSDASGALIPPSTEERNRVWSHWAKDLSVDLARRAIADAQGFTREDITHVIFTSCTGFANPGPDYHLIKTLGLRPNVERYTLGFMGCYAAFPSLRMAAQFCQANPEAVVLVVCLELCTLHMQVNDELDSILANSLFSDGAAAAIVSAREPQAGRATYRLDGFESCLVPASEADMAWEIGNEGFKIVLSSYVPDIIGGNIRQLLHGVLRRHGMDVDDVHEWAVHPGGRAILDKVQESLHLAEDSLDASRAVLRDYGNMSSATILFVLKEMLESAETESATLCAMAFGPGLTVETAVMQRTNCQVTPASQFSAALQAV